MSNSQKLTSEAMERLRKAGVWSVKPQEKPLTQGQIRQLKHRYNNVTTLYPNRVKR